MMRTALLFSGLLAVGCASGAPPRPPPTVVEVPRPAKAPVAIDASPRFIARENGSAVVEPVDLAQLPVVALDDRIPSGPASRPSSPTTSPLHVRAERGQITLSGDQIGLRVAAIDATSMPDRFVTRHSETCNATPQSRYSWVQWVRVAEASLETGDGWLDRKTCAFRARTTRTVTMSPLWGELLRGVIVDLGPRGRHLAVKSHGAAVRAFPRPSRVIHPIDHLLPLDRGRSGQLAVQVDRDAVERARPSFAADEDTFRFRIGLHATFAVGDPAPTVIAYATAHEDGFNGLMDVAQVAFPVPRPARALPAINDRSDR